MKQLAILIPNMKSRRIITMTNPKKKPAIPAKPAKPPRKRVYDGSVAPPPGKTPSPPPPRKGPKEK
jgi:hypothetical protein